MCELYNRLLLLCNNKGVTGAQMCRDCGMSKSLMSDLKYGRRDNISADTAAKIAEYFGITVDEVLLGIKKQPTESELNEWFYEYVSDLTPTEIEKVAEYIRFLKASRKE